MNHPALLWEKLPSGQVRCRACQWFCRINAGQYGVCRVYRNRAGELENLNYALVSSLAVDPIEKNRCFISIRGLRYSPWAVGAVISIVPAVRTGKSPVLKAMTGRAFPGKLLRSRR